MKMSIGCCLKFLTGAIERVEKDISVNFSLHLSNAYYLPDTVLDMENIKTFFLNL